MFDVLYHDEATVHRHRATMFGPYLEDYLEELWRLGHRHALLRRNVSVITRFGEHVAARGVREVAALSRLHLNGFLDDAQAGREPTSQRSGRSAAPTEHVLDGLLRHLEARGLWHDEVAAAPGVIDKFCKSLAVERALQPVTIDGYRRFAERLLGYLPSDGWPQDLSSLTAQDVDRFIVSMGKTYARSSMRAVCGAIRALLRYLYRKGLIARDLSLAVILPRFYALERLPRALPWETVRRVLDAVDPTRKRGLRDRAILALLVTYGMRPGEVVQLRIEDIDWRHDSIQFRRSKSGCPLSFPLTDEVGEAIVAYLRHGRPPTDARQVFVRLHAPHVALGRGSTVSCLVRHYLAKAGIESQWGGAYVIRHSLALHLLRKGHPLKTISDMLGHRDPHIAYHYTKLSIDDLRGVALQAHEVLP